MPSWCIWSMASIISIHAPARGATKVTVHFNQNHSNISIHAPARGATGDAKDIWLAVRNFNPRSREGSDHKFISSASKMRYFNPRSREGSDIQPTRNKRETADKFQSTLPRGERRALLGTLTNDEQISIHAPARGATPFGRIFRLFAAISIHAPARGATDDLLAFLGQDQDFNPRSREGSDGIAPI